MVTSKLTEKGQTTIPSPVRHALRLREGDEISYSIEGDVVTMQKAPSTTAEDPFDTFTKWDNDADRKPITTFEQGGLLCRRSDQFLRRFRSSKKVKLAHRA